MPVTPGKPPNGDGSWSDFTGLYAKALEHDHPGIPNSAVYNAFLAELKRGETTASRPIDPPLFEPRTTPPPPVPLLTPNAYPGNGNGKLNGPQGAFVIQALGAKSSDYHTVPAPKVGSHDYAVELIELYWASLVRDTPFS